MITLDDRAVNELIEIKNKHGNLNALIVLKYAKDESSSLHKYFEWDDRAAAQKYRMRQANDLIRAAKIRMEVIQHAGSMPKIVTKESSTRSEIVKTEIEDIEEKAISILKGSLKSIMRAWEMLDAVGRAHHLRRAVAAIEHTIEGRVDTASASVQVASFKKIAA